MYLVRNWIFDGDINMGNYVLMGNNYVVFRDFECSGFIVVWNGVLRSVGHFGRSRKSV